MDPFAEALLTFAIASTCGADEAVDTVNRMGQATVRGRLPKQCNTAGGRAALEAEGVVFGADEDELFQAVTLPEGWQIRRMEHPMWSKLVDSGGKVRANIFYKAAFYNRRADWYIPAEAETEAASEP